MTIAPPPPVPGFNISVTGHRALHASYPADDAQLNASLAALLDRVQSLIGETRHPGLVDRPDDLSTTRMHTLLADGVDQTCAHLAKAKGWELSIPLPFGEDLAMAINAMPCGEEDISAIIAGQQPGSDQARRRLAPVRDLMQSAVRFELADQDEKIAHLLLDSIRKPGNFDAAQALALETGIRFAIAARILIEQSHLMIAVWDCASVANIGGTGHTVTVALEQGVPVLWIDPAEPEHWRILHAPEALLERGAHDDHAQVIEELRSIIERSLLPVMPSLTGTTPRPLGLDTLAQNQWRDASNWMSHAYRRLETTLGAGHGERRWKSVKQYYETPEQIEDGSGKPMLSAIAQLPTGDAELAPRISRDILRRFAWADGIATHMSDSYRGGMTVNFLLGSFAIISGIAYLPLVDVSQKWIFALAEFIMLLAIIGITVNGQRKHLHQRWFEARRLAEYLRHSPLLASLGVSRTAGNWPEGTDTSWPEWYARQSLRNIGLPHGRITRDTLRHGLRALRDVHLRPQRNYHTCKAGRLNRVHERLEHISDRLFQFAVLIVGAYLVIAGVQAGGHFAGEIFVKIAKICTVLAVALPTLGGAIAGLRFFGDFERFASISEVTAEKLNALEDRITLLLDSAGDRLDYRAVADLFHAADAVVISEIENWQSVFSAKRISVPV